MAYATAAVLAALAVVLLAAPDAIPGLTVPSDAPTGAPDAMGAPGATDAMP